MIKGHVFIYFLAVLAVASSSAVGDFRLSLWKNYDLNSAHLVFSHSRTPSAVELLDRVQKQWTADYHLADELIHISFRKGSDLLEAVGDGDSLMLSGLRGGERLALSHIDS